MSSRRVVVCGGRDYDDPDTVVRVLALLDPRTTIVHGAQRGADTLADAAARRLGLPVERHPAEWQRLGRAAGPIRNREMVAGADLVIAFPGGVGTADALAAARAAGVLALRAPS